MRKSLIFLVASVAILGLAGLATGPSEAAQTIKYKVPLTNLTSSQPFSPPLLATHGNDVRVFGVAKFASQGIRAIAEDGTNAVLAKELGALPLVYKVVATDAPIHRKGGPASNTVTMTIAASAAATRLSVATMLICTNDAFTGVNSMALPTGSKPVVVSARAYDAGTEANDQLFRSIVDPCGGIGPVLVAADGGNARSATSEAIAVHPGIADGTGDLTAVHGWTDPVLEIKVARVGGRIAPPSTGDGDLAESRSAATLGLVLVGLIGLTGFSLLRARRA